MLRVSVIMPTYNRASFLRGAIVSVLGPTYPSLQLVVVDDGSTDSTARLVDEYVRSDRRVRYVRQAHRGVAAARNAGLESATGQVVGFCDSDDRWMPNKLERQVRCLEDDPEIGLVYSDVRSVSGSVVQVPSYFAERPPHDGWVFLALVEKNFIPTVSVLVRRPHLDIVGRFDESLSSSEDYELWLRFCRRFPAAYVRDVLVTVQRHSGNLTGDAQANYAMHLAVLDRVTTARGNPIPSEVVSRAYANTYFQIGYDYLVQRRFAQAQEALLKSWRYNPASRLVYRYLAASMLPGQVLNAVLDQRARQIQRADAASTTNKTTRRKPTLVASSVNER